MPSTMNTQAQQILVSTSEEYKTEIANINGLVFEIRRKLKQQYDFSKLEEIVEIIKMVIRTTTDKPAEQVINRVVAVFYTETVIDLVVDVNPQFKALYFGKEFTNQKAIRKLISNLCAKYTFREGIGHIIKIYNLE